jgi:hypothetical protein
MSIPLLDSIKKLESTLIKAGLPRFMARVPVWWLCWYYCRVLDDKIRYIGKVNLKFHKWVPLVRRMAEPGPNQMELIDVDLSMQGDMAATRSTLWELRGYCIDIGAMFDRLGFVSSALQRRQQTLLRLLEESCVSASLLIDTIAAHDRQALALLRAQQVA